MKDKRIPAARIRAVWLDESITTAEAARQVGLTRVNLWHRAKALGLPARRVGQPRRITDEAAFLALWRAGVPVAAIAARFGVGVSTVSVTARRLGQPCRTTTGGLVAFDRALACRMWRAGVKGAEIAAVMGVSLHAVSYAAKRAGEARRSRNFRARMTLAEFREAELASAMAAAAAQDRAERQRREHADRIRLQVAA